MARSRFWSITLNNPSYEPDFDADRHMYMIYQFKLGSTLHIQAYVEYNIAQRFGSVKKDFPGVHIEPARDLLAVRDSCCKEETRVAGPFEFSDWIPEMRRGFRMDHKRMREAAESMLTLPELEDRFPEFPRECKHPRTRVHDMTCSATVVVPRPEDWHQIVYDYLDDAEDDRILWVWETAGGRGKSTLARFLKYSRGAFYFPGGRAKDIAYAYDFQRIVVMDIPRSAKEYVNYPILEEFYNQELYAPKYESCVKGGTAVTSQNHCDGQL